MDKEFIALKRYAEKRKKEHRKAGKSDDWIASWERAFWRGKKGGKKT